MRKLREGESEWRVRGSVCVCEDVCVERQDNWVRVS